MKTIHALIACLLITTSLAGCFGDDDDDDPSTGCTDSDAVNYDSGADEDDGSCVMAAEQSELETAALTQMLDLDQRRSNGNSYGVEMVLETDSTIEGDSMSTVVTKIEIYDADDQSISYTYKYEIDGWEMGNYQVRQEGDIINVFSEEEWYLLNDENADSNNLLNAVIKKGNGDDISMDPYFTCDEEEYDIPMQWVNDGFEHCEDGTDEGVTQEEIDEILADGRQKTLFPDQEEFVELEWSMIVEDGYQTIYATNEEGDFYINFDENLRMVNYIAEAVDSEGLDAEFENTVSTITILVDDEISIEVSDDYPPAASPLLVERYYEARDFYWDCTLSYNIPADQIITEEEINSTIESSGSEQLPEWCQGTQSNSDFVHTFATESSSEYLWNTGFSTEKRSGDWGPSPNIFHTLRIDGYKLITTSLNASEHVDSFSCDEGGVSITFDAINDGVADCANGADEGTQPDVESGTYMRCDGLGYYTIAVYVAATNSCETTTNLTYVMMDDEYLNFIISEELEMWGANDKSAGSEFWFKNSSVSGDEDLSFIGEWSSNTLSDSNGLSPFAFIIEDEMNFQNDLDEFILEIGFEELNDAGEEEFTLHASFDLSQMQSGQSTDSSGNNWAFSYSDANGNNYLDAGDTIIVYTDYEDGWETPTVKLYHEWGQGYTDESPALLPGLTMLSTLFMLIVVALGRRIE
jgi:hypothetical protein